MHLRTWEGGGGGGGGGVVTLLPEKNYIMPECVILEIGIQTHIRANCMKNKKSFHEKVIILEFPKSRIVCDKRG